MNWESQHLARFLRGLARSARLIVTDRRGWGCSERFSTYDVADIDILTDDLLAVMDAAGFERATIIANLGCGLVSMLFAAAYPDRASGLVLVDCYPTYSWTEETPWAPTLDYWAEAAEGLRVEWGTPAYTKEWVDRREADWFDRLARASVTPGALAAEIHRYLRTDVRAILPSIRVPTLVFTDLDAKGETLSPPGQRGPARRGA